MKKLSGHLSRHCPKKTTCAGFEQEVHWSELGPLQLLHFLWHSEIITNNEFIIPSKNRFLLIFLFTFFVEGGGVFLSETFWKAHQKWCFSFFHFTHIYENCSIYIAPFSARDYTSERVYIYSLVPIMPKFLFWIVLLHLVYYIRLVG